MPNQPKTKARSVRVSDDLWEAAKVRAEQRGETVTDAIVRALRRYACGTTPVASSNRPERAGTTYGTTAPDSTGPYLTTHSTIRTGV